MKNVEYLIIGAGMAGITLKKFMASENVVLVDAAPFQYKIGESIIPEHYHNLVIRNLVPKIRELPSYSPKWGTTFVKQDVVVSFPLPDFLSALAMHVERAELERLMVDEWGIPISQETVKEIDFATKVVVTDKGSYKVEKQIIDCSGPAMVVGTLLGEVATIMPAFSTWAYFDVVERHDERFHQAIRDDGKKYYRFNVPEGELLAGEETDGWKPSRTTTLTEISQGLWTWQIPLFDATRLSFGVVSRHAPVSQEQLLELAEKTHGPQYVLRPRAFDGSSPYNRLHVRNMFARRAKVASTKDYILIADSFAFADPIYSVGTGLAVNKAIQVAKILNEGGWSEQVSEAYNTQYEALIVAALDGFNFWYTGDVLHNSAAAAHVQKAFLKGDAFTAGMSEQYCQSVVSSFGDKDSRMHERWQDLHTWERKK